MITINTDIGHDLSIGEFLDTLERYNGKLVSYIAEGPGGGNPNLTLAFPTELEAEGYVSECYPDDEFEDFLVES